MVNRGDGARYNVTLENDISANERDRYDVINLNKIITAYTRHRYYGNNSGEIRKNTISIYILEQ